MRPTPFPTLALLPLALLAAPALAQDVTDEDRAAIEARIAQFDDAMGQGDMAALFGYMPPKLMAYIAEQAGVPVEGLEDAVRAQLDAAMATVTVDEFGMDLDAATFQETPEGGRTYGLIPTTTTMTVDGAGTMRAESQTVALEDEGEWYLVRVDDPTQVAIIKAVYPEFADVEFQPGTMEAVE